MERLVSVALARKLSCGFRKLILALSKPLTVALPTSELLVFPATERLLVTWLRNFGLFFVRANSN